MAGHLGYEMYRMGTELKRHHLYANAAQVAAWMEFQAHEQILENVDRFKYLVQMLYFDES